MSKTLWGAMLAAVLPLAAHATLGEQESTVMAEAQQAQATVKSTDHASYRVHEMQLPSGTLLREFATTDGTVFAVAWNGPSRPDLRQAMGKYFDVYLNAAAAAQHRPRTRLQIRQDQFAMDMGGHMRAFTGRAYLPQAIPAGTAVEEIH